MEWQLDTRCRSLQITGLITRRVGADRIAIPSKGGEGGRLAEGEIIIQDESHTEMKAVPSYGDVFDLSDIT